MGKRQPTIHVTVNDLTKALEDMGIEDASTLANAVLKAVQPYQLRNRLLLKATKPQKTKLVKAVMYSEEDTAMLNKLLFTKQFTYRSYKHVNKDSQEHIKLKEAAFEAADFCKRNEYADKAEGFEIFVELGQEIMGAKFRVQGLKSYSQKIQEYYDISKLLSMGDNLKRVEQLFTVFKKEARKYTTHVGNIGKPIRDKGYLIWAVKEAEDANAGYSDWIQAQFEGLAFLEDIPKLAQLSGENAVSRYDEYMASKHYKKKEETGEKLHTSYASEAEKQYFERLRKMRADED